MWNFFVWFTDPAKKPSFHGRRFRFLLKRPTHEDKWDEYVMMRQQDFREVDAAGNPTDEFARHAHAFYLEHKSVMDAGAEVANLNRYTAAGLPGVSTNRRGQTLSYQYNTAGQVTRQTFADGTFITFAYDARGNLTTVTDGAEVTTYSYNFATDGDRLKRITYPNGRYLDYEYDAFGRRIRMTDQDNYQTRYEYDAAGRLYRLRDASDAILVTYIYDASGRLSRVDKGNGTFTTYDYDAAGQLLSLKNWRNATTLNSKFDYTYDIRSRRVAMTTLDGAWTYGYDGAGQLIRAVFVSLDIAVIPNQDLQYFYDSVGNRTRTILNGVTTIYATNNLNQYTSVGGVGQTYDADGNLTFDGVNTYSWDQQSRLSRLTGPQGVTEYEYDAFGNRTAKVENGVRAEFLFDSVGLPNITAEYDSTDQLIARSVNGLGLVSIITSGGSSYLDFDAIGNSASATQYDGQPIFRAAYLPFGDTILLSGTSAQTPTFNGAVGVTPITNDILDMRARNYSIHLGRFISADPANTAGGTNLYRFAINDPTSFLDPTGRFPDVTYLNGPVTCGKLSAEGCYHSNGNRIELDGSKAYSACILAHELQHATNYATNPGMNCLTNEYSAFQAGYDCAMKNKFYDFARTQQSWMTSIYNGSSVPGQAYPGCPNDTYLPGSPNAPKGGGTGSSGGNNSSQARGAFDPNDKLPGIGYGPESFVAATAAVPYRIDFENDATATAPAQYVTITDQLAANFNWSTFALTEIGWGDTLLTIPAGTQHYQRTVLVTIGGKAFAVLVEVGINTTTGQVYASFQSIDPATQLPPDVLTGFLPPEDGTGRGMGHFSYTVRAKTALTTGTEIRNVALISFDGQTVIATDQVDPHDPALGVDPVKQALVTLDAGLPTSSVDALPAITATSPFTINWSGSDEAGGSGLAFFDVFMSDNSGPFLPLLSHTTETSAPVTAQLGHHYRFYSIATDHVGLRQPTPAAPQAETSLLGHPWQNPADPLNVNALPGIVPLDALLIINELNGRQLSNPDTGQLPVPIGGQPPPYYDTNGDDFVTALDALLVINYINAHPLGGGEGESLLIEHRGASKLLGMGAAISPPFSPATDAKTRDEANSNISATPPFAAEAPTIPWFPDFEDRVPLRRRSLGETNRSTKQSPEELSDDLLDLLVDEACQMSRNGSRKDVYR